jgi:hypothetical protein
MKRKAVFLAASIAELSRFALMFFIAYDAGIAAGSARGDIFRYASSAQLLFAVGFFFLWLDPERYRQYGPLLLLGKAVCVALYAVPPIEALIAGGRSRPPVGQSLLGPAAAYAVAAADLLGLGALLYFRAAARRGGGGSARSSRAGDEPGPGPSSVDIERVEA